MPAYNGKTSTSLKQNLPVLHQAARRHVNGTRFDLPSALVAHLMVDHQRARLQPQFSQPPRNVALDTYRKGAKITDRRVPPGYRQTQTV